VESEIAAGEIADLADIALIESFIDGGGATISLEIQCDVKDTTRQLHE
jgi:hypothetical protein